MHDAGLVVTARALEPWLDRAAVLREVRLQLAKDLGVDVDELDVEGMAGTVAERLRARVLRVLGGKECEGAHVLRSVLYRVDVPEGWAGEAMRTDGLNGLSGAVVLRALQKVLTRHRYAALRGVDQPPDGQ